MDRRRGPNATLILEYSRTNHDELCRQHGDRGGAANGTEKTVEVRRHPRLIRPAGLRTSQVHPGRVSQA